MKKLNFWNEISGIGKLYIEKELVVGVELVLFVCTVDENTDQRYLIMTYDSYEGIYVMRKIDKGALKFWYSGYWLYGRECFQIKRIAFVKF